MVEDPVAGGKLHARHALGLGYGEITDFSGGVLVVNGHFGTPDERE
jgi:hypothetical protein